MLPFFGPGGVVTDDALDRADIAMPARLPPRLLGHFQSGIQQNLRQPSQRKRHVALPAGWNDVRPMPLDRRG